jgi:hypothetical protein
MSANLRKYAKSACIKPNKVKIRPALKKINTDPLPKENETQILAYYTGGRGFDLRTVQTFVCITMSACIGSGRFYV